MTGPYFTTPSALVCSQRSKGESGADSRTRTCDLWINSPPLHQLSYVGLTRGWPHPSSKNRITPTQLFRVVCE